MSHDVHLTYAETVCRSDARTTGPAARRLPDGTRDGDALALGLDVRQSARDKRNKFRAELAGGLVACSSGTGGVFWLFANVASTPGEWVFTIMISAVAGVFAGTLGMIGGGNAAGNSAGRHRAALAVVTLARRDVVVVADRARESARRVVAETADLDGMPAGLAGQAAAGYGEVLHRLVAFEGVADDAALVGRDARLLAADDPLRPVALAEARAMSEQGVALLGRAGRDADGLTVLADEIEGFRLALQARDRLVLRLEAGQSGPVPAGGGPESMADAVAGLRQARQALGC